MAEKIKLGGKPSNRLLIYVGGAAAVGIVGYAWLTKSSGKTPVDEFAVDPFGDERITPTTIDSSRVSVDTRTGITNNADWGELAVERLVNIGLEGSAVSSAIGKFLQHIPLSKVEADLVRQAIRAAGTPPQGGPWTVIEDPNPAAVGMGQPKNIEVDINHNNTASIRWDPVPGASGYEIRDLIGTAMRSSQPLHNTGVLSPRTYNYEVKAYNSANNYGEPASIIFTIV